MPGKSNKDVKLVYVKNQNVKTYPYNIFSFFPDLKKFSMIVDQNEYTIEFRDGKIVV